MPRTIAFFAAALFAVFPASKAAAQAHTLQLNLKATFNAADSTAQTIFSAQFDRTAQDQGGRFSWKIDSIQKTPLGTKILGEVMNADLPIVPTPEGRLTLEHYAKAVRYIGIGATVQQAVENLSRNGLRGLYKAAIGFGLDSNYIKLVMP